MEDASFTLKVRPLTTEVMDTLLYGRVSRNLGQVHIADLRTAHKNPPPHGYWLPTPTAHRPPHIDPEGYQHNVISLRRPPSKAASSLREPYIGRQTSC